jgi:hypothetical protein
LESSPHSPFIIFLPKKFSHTSACPPCPIKRFLCVLQVC